MPLPWALALVTHWQRQRLGSLGFDEDNVRVLVRITQDVGIFSSFDIRLVHVCPSSPRALLAPILNCVLA